MILVMEMITQLNNFNGNSDPTGNAIIFFTPENVKENVLGFWQLTVRVL